MMTTEQKQILTEMQWIPEEEQDICEICKAILVDGEPVYDDKTSQRLKCVNYDIKQIMNKIKTRKQS